MALHLHELEGADLLVGGEGVAGLCAEEAGDGLLAAIEQDVDIGVASGPYISEEDGAGCLSEGDEGIAQLVEGLAERRAPLLMEAGLATVATAVGTPPLNAVDAAP